MRRALACLVVSLAGAAHAAPLTEKSVAPAFTKGDERAGADAFAREDWAAARDAFTKALTHEVPPDAAGRVELMIALADENLSQWADAEAQFNLALAAKPELADYINYHLARVAYFARDFDTAKRAAMAVSPDAVAAADAQMLLGDLLRLGTDWAAIGAHYEAYLKAHPDFRRSEARFWLAGAREHTEKTPAAAIALYRQIWVEDPLSSWAAKAHARISELHGSDALNADEHVAQGMVLFDGMRNPESEAAFSAALADPHVSAAAKCTAAYNEAQSRFKARDRRGAAPLFDAAAVACRASHNNDLEIKSNYQAGRSYSFFGEHDTAIHRYQAAQTIDPAHSYADDAMLREAEEWASLNNDAKVKEILGALPTKFPKGDNIAEAEWRLGWRAWRAKDYDAAIAAWKKQIELVPHDDNYFAEGEPQYWLGRALLATGKKAAAIASWQDTIRSYPAAYYALLALNRLRETSPKAYAAMLAEISRDPPADPKALSFKDRPEWSTPGFARALEFLRLGLDEPAAGELRKLGLAAPTDKKRVDDPDQLDKLWAVAFLYDRANHWSSSVWLARWHVLDYRTKWPVGINRARWLIAYPHGYWDILTRHATKNKVPSAMQVAIVREESGFDPLDESYANAIGLTQMIPPTAKDFSKGTGIDPTRENLRDPEKNVTIGSRFLGSLFKTWHDYVVLVPPSYNAGPAAVRKMLRARGTWDADEFVEGIVDDQARNYTKRVLGSFFTYTWLYEHKVPVIANRIPPALLPKD
ncbi:MAG TPA: transglycosylase SLT domain-containing protein [Kofleriaceae bacterium]|jgi:soluble lytic murein transglycosylase